MVDARAEPRAARGVAPTTSVIAPTLRQVFPLVSDLLAPRPRIYWADLLVTAAVGWGALFACAAAPRGPAGAVSFAVAVLALYRGAAFIHEIVHLRPGAVRGFSACWNAVLGIPLLLPSMLYLGVHGIHHSRAHFGTERDPEYLPLGTWPAWKLAAWVLHAGLLPVALVLRFLLLAPLSLVDGRLRRWTWERASSLSVNPRFRRGAPPRGMRAAFAAQEAACFVWALALTALTARGIVPARYTLIGACVASLVGLLNQLRTAVAHRFTNDGVALTWEEQFLDSVTVAGRLAALWAPVGLRFHALHHLIPGLPYHALGAAHRRVAALLPPVATYHRATEPTLASALRALARGAPRAARA